jgi:hypothetical protein
MQIPNQKPSQDASHSFRGKIDQLGLNILADLRTLKFPWEQETLVTSKTYLETKQDTLSV